MELNDGRGNNRRTSKTTAPGVGPPSRSRSGDAHSDNARLSDRMLALADRIERHEVPRERLAPLMALIGEIENGNTWYRYGDGGDAAPSSRMGEHRHGQDSPGHGGA